MSSPLEHSYNKSLDHLLQSLRTAVLKKRPYENGFVSDYHRKRLKTRNKRTWDTL